MPADGVSMRYTFTAPQVPSARRVQRYEALGARAIYVDGWKAIAGRGATTASANGTAAAWALYHVAADRAEIHDVAASYPVQAAQLASLWEAPAGDHAGGPQMRRVIQVRPGAASRAWRAAPRPGPTRAG